MTIQEYKNPHNLKIGDWVEFTNDYIYDIDTDKEWQIFTSGKKYQTESIRGGIPYFYTDKLGLFCPCLLKNYYKPTDPPQSKPTMQKEPKYIPVTAVITPENMHLITRTVTGIEVDTSKTEWGQNKGNGPLRIYFKGFPGPYMFGDNGMADLVPNVIDLDLTPIIQAENPPETWRKGDQVRLIGDKFIVTFEHLNPTHNGFKSNQLQYVTDTNRFVLHARLEQPAESLSPAIASLSTPPVMKGTIRLTCSRCGNENVLEINRNGLAA